MVIWPLNPILTAIIKVLSDPAVLIYTVLFNIYGEALSIYRIASAGQAVTAGMVLSLLRGGLLAIFIFGLIVLICVDTVKRVMFAESMQKNVFFDIILSLLVLSLYYVIFSVVLYVFLNVVFPIARIL